MAVGEMLNNWMHDFSVALLAVCLMVIWWSGRDKTGFTVEVQRKIFDFLTPITLVCWAVLAVAGAVRMWAYRDYEWLPAAGREQVAALVVKHAVLGGAVFIGLIAQIRLWRRIRIKDK